VSIQRDQSAEMRFVVTNTLIVGEDACTESRSNSFQPISYPDDIWPENQVTVLPWTESSRSEHAWDDDTDAFAGVVSDRGHLEIRSFQRVEREGCSFILATRIALG